MEITPLEQASYFEQALTWDADRESLLLGSLRSTRHAALALLLLALSEAFALATLVPLKSVEGYVVRVDSSTGIVDRLTKLEDAKSDYDETVSKYFLQRVVQLREGYSRAELESNYAQSVLFTAPDQRAALKAAFAFENPQSPYRVFGEIGTAEIRVLNISFLAKQLAQVRYVRIEHHAGVISTVHRVATINFRYVAAPASEATRGINPLGFQVTSYRNDDEIVTGNP
jgi:type IV secretion system protein VirB8